MFKFVFDALRVLLNAIFWLVLQLFVVISYFVWLLCEGLQWLYRLKYTLYIHAIVTYFAVPVTFSLSSYWAWHMGIYIDLPSHQSLPCSCPPVPSPALSPTIDHHHLGVITVFFIKIWHAYGGLITQTAFYIGYGVYAGTATTLVINWRSDSLVRLREACAPLATFGQLYKSFTEVCVLRLILLLGDVFCDPKQVDWFLFLTFVLVYLHFASVLKLIGIGNDFGSLDGLVSVVLAAFEHFARKSFFMQFVGILLTTIIVVIKNAMWTGHGRRLPI